MATKYSYPGVYVEEIPSGERSITGVSTSVTAFLGFTQKGPVNKAVRLYNFGDYERNFGGLSRDSEIGYQLRQYFLNGGTEAYVIRTATGAAKASAQVRLGTGGTDAVVLEVTATSEGAWGNYLRVDVDYAASNPDSEFNLTVTEYKQQGTSLVASRTETHRNLSMNSKASNYAVSVINAASQLVSVSRVTVPAAVTAARGMSQSGEITSAALAALGDSARSFAIYVDGAGPETIEIFAAGATPPADLDALATAMQTAVAARFSGFTVVRADSFGAADPAGDYLLMQSGATGEFSSVRIINAGSSNAATTLHLGIANGGRERSAAALMRPAQTGLVSADLRDVDLSTLSATEAINVSVGTTVLTLGSATTAAFGSTVTNLSELRTVLEDMIRKSDPSNPALKGATVQVTGTRLRIVSSTDSGDALMTITDAGGSLAATLGLTGAAGAAANVQRYSLGIGSSVAAQVAGTQGNDGTPPGATELLGSLAAKTGLYALEDVDIFNILCVPRTAELDETSALSVVSAAVEYAAQRRSFAIVDPPDDITTATAMETFITSKLTPNKNAAVYYPWVQVADPTDGYRLRAIPPSGTIAGLYARIDATRGVWKAPAGTEATLKNVQGLAYNLTDAENGALNPLGVNCLRNFPVYGRVCWGARTLEGADVQASEWKYLPVRRLALYIEESLFRGTKWVVFEPNDEPLWSQIRLGVGSFMHRLFRQGAFQGSTPREAYFVKCDSEVTTQDDVNQGVVNILVGFAPLKPAEFVVIKLQQIAGQAQT